jgi:hypothetical protein
MFGFVNSEKECRGIGGEAFRAKQKRNKIIYSILGLLGLIFLNLIFYMMTRV